MQETTRVRKIRCPHHHVFEEFTPGAIPQPHDTSLVRYPCGYVDGIEPTAPPTQANTGDLALQVQELREEVGRFLSTRPAPAKPEWKATPRLEAQPPKPKPAFYQEEGHDADHFA